MVKAPSFGRIAAMVLFALSCFGLLLFLWLAFGGPVPLKPKGYRFHASFAEATQLSTEADVRISGVPVGKVKTIKPDKHDGPLGRDDPAPDALRAAAVGRDARSCARRRCWARPTSSSRRARRTLRRFAEGGTLPAAQVSDTVELDEILRSFDPPTRAAFQIWMQTQGRGDRPATGTTSTTRSATSPRSPRTRRGSSTSSTARRARSRA